MTWNWNPVNIYQQSIKLVKILALLAQLKLWILNKYIHMFFKKIENQAKYINVPIKKYQSNCAYWTRHSPYQY